MKTFKVRFLHTDGDTREVTVEAYNIIRAKFRFEVDWGRGIKILKIYKHIEQ